MANMNISKQENLFNGLKETNHVGEKVHALSLLEELYQRTMGAYLGEATAYESHEISSDFQRLRDIIAQIPSEQAEYVMKIAAIGRACNMISYPLAVFTVACNDDKFRGQVFCDENGINKMGTYADKIIRRGKDVTEVLASQLSVFGRDKAIPKQMRKALKRKIEAMDAYQLTKALGKNSVVSMADAIKLVRPGDNKPIYKDIIEGKAKFANGKQQVQTILQKPTEEGIQDSLTNSSLFAIIKNLRALFSAKVMTEENATLICDKLTNADIVRKSRILPYQFYDAYKAVKDISGKEAKRITDALSRAVDLSVDNVDSIEGYTAFFVDLSGSMRNRVSGMSHTDQMELGAVLAAIGAKKSTARIYAFASVCKEVPFSASSSVVDITSRILDMNVGGRTYLLEALRHVESSGEQFDNVVVLSDQDVYQRTNDNSFCISDYQQSYDAVISRHIKNHFYHRFFINDLSGNRFSIINTGNYSKNLVTGFSEHYIDEINGCIFLEKNASDFTKLIDLLYEKYYPSDAV